MEENWLNDEYVRYYNRAYTTSSEEFDRYLPLLRINSNDFVLDLGCGDGSFLEVLAPLVRGARGVDISALQIDLANTKLKPYPACKAVRADFNTCASVLRQENLPLFTKGFSRKALHHLTDKEKSFALQSLAPLFAPQAILYIEDGIFYNFARESLEKHLDELLAECADYYGTGWESKRSDLLNSFYNEYPTGIDFWERELQLAGFEVVERLPRSSFYGGLKAIKR